MDHLTPLLDKMIDDNASDIMIRQGVPTFYKVNGVWALMGDEALDDRVIEDLLPNDRRALLEKRRELDFSIATGKSRFRVNVFYERGNISAVLRSIPTRIPQLESLGLPGHLRNLTRDSQGLVLVTGPTGSGKSTTLAALIDHINESYTKHILTIEDPIEFVHYNKKSVITQQEVGPAADAPDFAAAVRGSLRKAPDVILVGEMRDLETISSAITAAETGHLVMGTLHTNSAAETIDRVIDVFPHESQNLVRTQLANVLRAVITQQLIPAKPTGRALAYELMLSTHAVKALIRDGKTHQIPSVIQTSTGLGMRLMETSLAQLYLENRIEFDIALDRARDKKTFENQADRSVQRFTPQEY
jgi:twitching motility protein PilT